MLTRTERRTRREVSLARHLLVGALTIAGCGACGGQSAGAGSTGAAKAEGSKIDPRVAIIPEGAEDEPIDAVFDNPLLATGVTSTYQPSYFYDPDEATDPPVPVRMVAGAEGVEGTGLSGTGDLTMLLVFDKSSSMLFDWDGKTRWQVANESLRAALDGILDELTIGVIRFPLEADCFVPEFDSGQQIEFTSGRNFVNLWQQMPHKLESLGTPLGAALAAAERAIVLAESEGRLDSGRFRVVLVTDGEPNCGYTIDLMTQIVAGWYQRGIETLVIGLPGTGNALTTLDALALAGGTGQVTVTHTQDQLGASFAAASR